MPPAELLMAFDCERYSCLPAAGGVLDQPAGLLRKMTRFMNVYLAFTAYAKADKTKMAAWKKNNSEMWQIVKEVNALRKETKTNG